MSDKSCLFEPSDHPELLMFSDLREANLFRLPQFKNALGGPAHTKPDGSDWSDAQWLMAVTGELGELANLLKKKLRGDLAHRTEDDVREEIGDELADVQIYLDILAFRLGVDLNEAVIRKFNKVSRRVGCDVFLTGLGAQETDPDFEEAP